MAHPDDRATVPGFLLTRSWRDTRDGIELVFWLATDRGPARVRLTGVEAVCFVERGPTDVAKLAGAERARPLPLTTLEGRPVDGLYFRSQRRLNGGRDTLRAAGARPLESDVKPTDRFLMERFITGGLKVDGAWATRDGWIETTDPVVTAVDHRADLQVVSLDIETSGLTGELLSIAVTRPDDARVFLLRSEHWTSSPSCADGDLSVHGSESELLATFFEWLRVEDPDVLIGWNVVNFDLTFLERRCHQLDVPFRTGRGGELGRILAPSGRGRSGLARLPGRVVLDGIDTLRAATWPLDDLSLGAVARTLLGRDKLITGEADRVEEIVRLHREDPDRLVAYNLTDCRLVEEIFDRAGLLEFAVERTRLTGLDLDRVGGSVAAFDFLYLPRLHRAGRVAPDVGDHRSTEGSPGGHVLESIPGLHDNVLLLDFKSLYPSLIRSFLIDPLGLASADDGAVPGFRGASFSREHHVLPELIRDLWEARDRAKTRDDDTLSRAIKIIMNSFYGVLAAPGCRFFDPRLASSITLRGHEVLERTRERIEELGWRVIYGDTDSVFVLVGPDRSADECRAIGAELATSLNDHWSRTLREEHALDSCLEVEFESHFARFLMPTVRGSARGTKKRYAGLVRDGERSRVVFRGMESVRSDSTPLARRVQQETYRRVFEGEPFTDYLRDVVARLRDGELDDELVYRKRLRRPVSEYRSRVPPHVQAARKSPTPPSRWVRYVITTGGPEPLDARASPLDHEHYVKRQLAPAVDSLLYFLDTSLAAILDDQLWLF